MNEEITYTCPCGAEITGEANESTARHLEAWEGRHNKCYDLAREVLELELKATQAIVSINNAKRAH